MNRWDDFRFTRSRPRQAKGGIRAQSKRGAFGESWWAKRWIAALEGLQLSARLQRGRSYARRGQVLSIDVGKGTIIARVQGSRPKPYDVTINVRLLSAADWKKVAGAVASQAIFGAKLFAGEMPQEIETAFRAAGVPLFPERGNDLQNECTCPDISDPCKHIAAVYYLLGEEFDRDPFLIFKMRGMSREEFLELMGGAGGDAGIETAPQEEHFPKEPLPASYEAFWTVNALPGDLAGSLPEAATAALPKRLGSFPFWRGKQRFLETLDSVYAAAAARAGRILSEG
ncbi:MAG TPA: SWIM zinc finger family protein [Bryobacteraceae bacterium]|nr:SWIM zinc finger family protein [Bryobacteraceae bacterium]